MLNVKKIMACLNVIQYSHAYVNLSYLLVCMIVGVDVIVKLLMFLVLLITQFTVEVGPQFL